MSGCGDGPSRLNIDLDDEVSRGDLADCLASGWSAEEIAEELGLEGYAAVVRWCRYHDLPVPHAAPRLPPPAAPVQEVTAIRMEPAPTVVSAPAPVQIQAKRSAAGGGKRTAAVVNKRLSAAEQRRRDSKRAAYERGQALTLEAALTAYEQAGSYARAARQLGVSTHRLTTLLKDNISAAQRQRERHARRESLTRAAVKALKRAGASLNDVYGMVRAHQTTIKAIYNGETT